MTAINSNSDQTTAFEADVAEVLKRMRNAFAEVIDAVPDVILKGADLHHSLRIDRKLSWKIFKVANSTDPIAAGPHVPTKSNMTTFIKAAKKKGVPDNLLESASTIAREFERLVVSHAGDRSTFDTMVCSLSKSESTEQMELVHRRLAFRGQRHILGAYANAQLKLVAMQPSQNPDQVDALKVEGFIGLRRLRGDAPLVVSYSGARRDDGTPMAIRREPLDPQGESHDMALLKPFCTQPPPEFRTIESGQGFVKGELIGNEIGNHAAVTCIEGHITPAALPRYRDQDNRFSGTVAPVRMPCEVLLLDLLLHKDAYGPIRPEIIIYPEHFGEINWEAGVENRPALPGQCNVDYLGRGPSALHADDLPNYAEMGAYIFNRAGWQGDDFDVYRCRIEYPALPSSVVMRYDLPYPPPR